MIHVTGRPARRGDVPSSECRSTKVFPMKSIFAVLLLFFLPTLTLRADPTPQPLLKPNQAAVKIMPLGDSITLGLSTVADGGYRKLLQNFLASGGYRIVYVGKEDNGQAENVTKFSVGMTNGNHEGYGSFGISDLINGNSKEGHTGLPIAATMANDRPNIVLMMIGTNNCIGGQPAADMDADLKTLLQAIYLSRPHVAVVLASVPPMRDAQREAHVKAFNETLPGLVAQERAAGRKIVFADVSSAMNSDGDLTYDGVHPTMDGYRKIADVWYQALTGHAPPR